MVFLFNNYFQSLGFDKELLPKEDIKAINNFNYKNRNGIYNIYSITKEELEDVNLNYNKVFPVDVAILWSDGKGNYAGVFTEGLLKGRVCLIDKEKPLFVPVYKSIDSFLQRIYNCKITDLKNKPIINSDITDYPTRSLISKNALEDLMIAKVMLSNLDYSDVNNSEFIREAETICYLTPSNNYTILEPLLEKANSTVRELILRLFSQYDSKGIDIQEDKKKDKLNLDIRDKYALIKIINRNRERLQV